jgi:hypothetical protein
MNGDPNKMPSITVPDTFTPIKRNRWIVSEEDKYAKFAHWTAKFSQGQMIDPWEQWEFWKKVLQAGEEEGVFRVEKIWDDPPLYDKAASGQSYADYVEQTLRQTGELVFFQQLSNHYSLDAPARICYYDLEGKVVEAEPRRSELGGLGGLLSQFRPDVVQDWKSCYLSRNHNPLELRGQKAWERKREDFLSYTDEEFEQRRFRQAYLDIEIYTDIWFPWISGYMEDEDRGWKTGFVDGKTVIYQEGEWYDNRELAMCHTPRLNRFIQRVKQLTLDYGGEWSIDRADAKGSWDSHWNEDGIVLDI